MIYAVVKIQIYSFVLYFNFSEIELVFLGRNGHIDVALSHIGSDMFPNLYQK